MGFSVGQVRARVAKSIATPKGLWNAGMEGDYRLAAGAS